MRVLVCGSRTFSDEEYLFAALDDFHKANHITLIIEGEAPGADTLAKLWAIENHIPWKEFPADWERYGKAAGPIRNLQMLDEGKPEAVLGFIDKPLEKSRGTKNMLTQADNAGLSIIALYDAMGGE